jgi:lysylphosphatidylglycerol synthetase-like protein (DUF2156 family)
MNNYLKTSNAGQGMSTAALILGIFAVIVALIPCFLLGFISIFLGVLAMIFGVIGYMQAKKGNAPTTMPIVGLVLGFVATAFTLLWAIFFLGLFSAESFAHESEMRTTIDSIHTETIKQQDSLNNTVETITDSIAVEEPKE